MEAIPPVLQLNPGDGIFIRYGKKDADQFEIVEETPDGFIIRDMLGERGEFEVSPHEISDFMNGSKVFSVKRGGYEALNDE